MAVAAPSPLQASSRRAERPWRMSDAIGQILNPHRQVGKCLGNLEEDCIVAWTRITDPETVTGLLPAWLGRRMVGLRGCFGLLMTTGDVVRLTSIAAAHQSSEGVILLDVLLDKAGVPDGLDLAWRSKHFLGAPVPGATVATVNLAHVVAAVEFTVAEMAANPGDNNVGFGDEIQTDDTSQRTEAVGQPVGQAVD